MSNSIGRLFVVTTWGESHGQALGAVIDGCPAGVFLSLGDIEKELARDIPDIELGTKRDEPNKFEILSGWFQNRTLGTPISIIIHNIDYKTSNYKQLQDLIRPGHADYTYIEKYGHREFRGGGRASGRECIARLAAGAVAKKVLSYFEIGIESRVIEMAGIPINSKESYQKAKEASLENANDGESTGGIVELRAKNLPVGAGSPIFGKLDAELALALMSIGGIKGVEIGAGFSSAKMKASESNDEFYLNNGKIRCRTNNAGGLLSGISTGEDLVVTIAVKPTPAISKPQKTVNIKEMKEAMIECKGRFDLNFTPRVAPIAEAMAGIILTDELICSGYIHPSKISSSSLLKK
ncbi:MAG: chorismate synthase [bacterium]|nr:chorismate synthase [bacterium]